MKDEFDIVSGSFEGNFFTHQSHILTTSEWNSVQKNHQIHLYRGELKNIKVEESLNIEDNKNRESLILYNVTNVQFHLGANENGENINKIFDFELVIIKDALIKESWDLNNKTYGIVTGKLIGKVKQKKSEPIDSVKKIILTDTPKTTAANSTFNRLKDFDLKKIIEPSTFIIDPNWKNTSYGCVNPGCINPGCINPGCLNKGCINFGGCLSNIWRILTALLLLIFLLWLLKGCLRKTNSEDDCSVRNEMLSNENNQLKNELDSLNKIQNEKNEDLKKDKIQNKLNELSSRVYFYGGTTKIRKFSEKQLTQIVDILRTNKKLEVQIIGYYNGSGAPNKIDGKTIDAARAETIKSILVEKGVEPSRISTIGKGQSKIDPEEFYNKIKIEDETFEWNRNMRVEVKIIKF
jgi:outer membrane protein OmpA-like peptidoglycan-associated protein